MDGEISKLERSWIDLPMDVTANILQRLGPREILESAQRVCTTWLNVCKDPSMWRIIDMRNLQGGLGKQWAVFRRAVDLSQGQLIDININIQYFGDDNSIEYLTKWSTQLRCLRIASCSYMTGKHLAEQIVKFSFLEELHLCEMTTTVFARNIEAIGSSCSKLKAFTFDNEYFIPTRSDGLAHAVAKSMPGLLHLRLVRNQLTNKGLLAILDGCPLLESLDIRECFHVILEGGPGKICSQHMIIKSLKRPLDSMDSDQCVTYHGVILYDNTDEESDSASYDTAEDSGCDYYDRSPYCDYDDDDDFCNDDDLEEDYDDYY